MKMSNAWTCLLVVACRWGGPEGNPSDLFGPRTPPGEQPGAAPSDTAGDPDGTPANAAPPEALAPSEAGGFSGGIDETGPDFQGGVATDDGGETDDAPDGVDDEVSDGDDGAAEDAGPPPLPQPAASCAAPAGLLCDPVGNVGCLPLTQCVVDPNAAAAAGYCVVAGISLDGACTQDLLSTSCPPEHTCIAGQCREYCYCDADCDDGTACSDPSGQGGSDAFQLCALAP